MMPLPYQLHTGRELEMMLAGTKPLAMFYDDADAEPNEEIVPELTFDQYVREGKFSKKTWVDELAVDPRTGRPVRVRYVLYALALEAWRLEAMYLVHQTILRMGADEGVERMTGSLLGYTHEQNDAYIASWRKKRKSWNLVETLLRENWDPLHIRNEPKAEDEYHSYAGVALRWGQAGDVQGLKDYLTSIERDQMGINPDPTKNESLAAIIVDRLKQLQAG